VAKSKKVKDMTVTKYFEASTGIKLPKSK